MQMSELSQYDQLSVCSHSYFTGLLLSLLETPLETALLKGVSPSCAINLATTFIVQPTTD